MGTFTFDSALLFHERNQREEVQWLSIPLGKYHPGGKNELHAGCHCSEGSAPEFRHDDLGVSGGYLIHAFWDEGKRELI